MQNIIILGLEKSSGIAQTRQVITILILFILVFLGAYYASRLLGKSQFIKRKASNLKVMEAISVGPQKTVQLLKIGNEYILIGVTKDRITFMKEISEGNIDLNLFESNSNNVVPFSQYMEKFLKLPKKK